MKRLLLCLALVAPLAAPAQSMHQQLLGTRVSGEFSLGPATFYLPAGSWVLAAREAWTGSLNRSLEGPKFAGVLLVDLRDGQMARAIVAIATLTPVLGGIGWLPSVDPCKRHDDVYLHRELGPNINDQYCVRVNHRVPFLLERQDWPRRALGFLADQKVTPPLTVVGVEFMQIDRANQRQLFYFFNPEADGIPPSAAKEWMSSEWHRDRVAQDPAHAAYIEALAKWSGEAAPAVLAGFKGDHPPRTFPQPPYPAKE